MEKNKRLVGFLHGITTFGFYFSIVIAALLTVATIVLQFVPLPEVGDSFLQSRFIFDDTFTVEMSVQEGANFLPIVTRFLVMAITGVLTLTGFSYLLKEILQNVKKDKVFVEQNSLYIKYLGYAMIGASVVLSILKFWASVALMNVINIPGAHFGANFSFNFETIFIGLIIVVLSQIFAYGTHLQNEYDATV